MLDQDEDVPFTLREDGEEVPGIQKRVADTGGGVIDLAAMRDELEAARRKGR
jgi:hypothetical protein